MKKILTVILLVTSFSVLAGNPHHNHNNEVPTVNNYTSEAGVASAMASSLCDIDRSTYKLQGCASVGFFNSNSAFGISLGRRLNNEGDTIKFNFTKEGSNDAGGVGYGIVF